MAKVFHAIDEMIQRLLPAVGRAVKKAVGSSGYGTITIDFKKFKPAVEWTNKDREPIDDPEE